jgi:hypothetical protein
LPHELACKICASSSGKLNSAAAIDEVEKRKSEVSTEHATAENFKKF